MKEIFIALSCVIIGMTAGFIISQNDTEQHFGYRVTQGLEYKEQCEANLPRNVHCSTVVLYVPDNESEQ